MSWGTAGSDGTLPQVTNQWNDKRRSTAPFYVLWIFLAVNAVTVASIWVFKPTGIDSWVILGIDWVVSLLLLVAGYYVFSVSTQKAKLNPDYSTNPSSEMRNRLIYLLSSFILTCFAAFPLAYELSRLVRL